MATYATKDIKKGIEKTDGSRRIYQPYSVDLAHHTAITAAFVLSLVGRMLGRMLNPCQRLRLGCVIVAIASKDAIWSRLPWQPCRALHLTGACSDAMVFDGNHSLFAAKDQDPVGTALDSVHLECFIMLSVAGDWPVGELGGTWHPSAMHLYFWLSRPCVQDTSRTSVFRINDLSDVELSLKYYNAKYRP